jgi:hypothetical protein
MVKIRTAGLTRLNTNRKDTMKTLNTLLFACALTVGFTLTHQATADVFLSPRAQANQIKVVSGTGTSPTLVSADYLGAGAKAAALFPVTVLGQGEASPNLVNADYLGAAAKNPARELRAAQFEIAPVVEKNAQPKAGCCSGCCHDK